MFTNRNKPIEDVVLKDDLGQITNIVIGSRVQNHVTIYGDLDVNKYDVDEAVKLCKTTLNAVKRYMKKASTFDPATGEIKIVVNVEDAKDWKGVHAMASTFLDRFRSQVGPTKSTDTSKPASKSFPAHSGHTGTTKRDYSRR